MPKQRLVIDNFLGGQAPSSYIGNQTMQDPSNSEGWDVMTTGQENILQRGYGTSAVTNASYVDGYLWAMKVATKPDGSNKVYGLAAGSNYTSTKLHEINISDDTVNNSSPWPWTIAGATSTNYQTVGLEIYNGYLYYAGSQCLGRYDMSLTFNNCYNVSLQADAYGKPLYHPMVQGNGSLFVGHGKYVAKLSGEVMNITAMDLSKTSKVVKCMEFNRNYLYMGVSTNYGNANINSEASLIIWDTVSEGWQEEFRFPENDLTAIKSANGTLYCWGDKGFYRFTGSNFELISVITGSPAPWGVDVTPRGLIIFKDGAGHIYQYGSSNPGLNPILQKVINEANQVQLGGLKSVTRTKYYSGAYLSGDNIRAYSSAGGTRPDAGVYATPFLNLGQKIRVSKIYAYAQNLLSGCSLSFALYDEDGSSIDCGYWNTAGEKTYEYQPNGAVFDTFQLRMTHLGTSPKIRKFVIEYEPEKE